METTRNLSAEKSPAEAGQTSAYPGRNGLAIQAVEEVHSGGPLLGDLPVANAGALDADRVVHKILDGDFAPSESGHLGPVNHGYTDLPPLGDSSL